MARNITNTLFLMYASAYTTHTYIVRSPDLSYVGAPSKPGHTGWTREERTRSALVVRRHSSVVRRARWTNDFHSWPFAWCDGIFVRGARRIKMYTPDGRRTCAGSDGPTSGKRGAHARYSLYVRMMRRCKHPAHT